ncbi:MAG: hypothetical protein JJ974_01860 [Phycisphaerales bacterium]|nr:hypothetical protein [Phycisphaerales bacterium]
MNWNRTARGAADVKLIIAILFAVGGLSWAVVSFLSSGSSENDNEPRVVASALDDEGNEVDTAYTKASTQKQIDRVQAEIESVIRSQAVNELNKIDAPKGLPDGISDATINAFIPILSGDQDSFFDAIQAMGGELPGDLESEHPLFKHLAGVFKHAKVDLNRITVERFVEEPRGGGMRMRREVTAEEAEDVLGGEEQRTRIQSQVMEMHPASIFPDAPPKQDATAVQIKIPVQPKGEKHESVFALILTWNKDAKLWQPAAYQMINNRRMEDG